jgi:hypothetical protein
VEVIFHHDEVKWALKVKAQHHADKCANHLQ